MDIDPPLANSAVQFNTHQNVVCLFFRVQCIYGYCRILDYPCVVGGGGGGGGGIFDDSVLSLFFYGPYAKLLHSN